MAALAEFVPDFRMDAQGMSLASPENKAQWILEHHIEFQKRQAIWAELAKSMAKPIAAPAASALSLMGVAAEKARQAIVASKNACASLWEGPFSQAGSRPRSLLKQAMMLSGTSPSIGRELLDEDLVKLLDNVADLKIATFSHCYDPVVFSEDASLASQASLVDTNAAASLAKYIRTNMTLIMAANNMSKPNSDYNVWVWANNLNVIVKELGEQHFRFSANLCALLKSGPPVAVVAEGQEAHELKRSQHVAKIASLEGLLARIKGCTLVIQDLAAWAEFFKSGDAQEQVEAQALLAGELNTIKAFFDQALVDGDRTAFPPRFAPKTPGAPKDLHDLFKKICDGRKNRAERFQQQLRNPAPYQFGAAAAAEATQTLGKRGNGNRDTQGQLVVERPPGTSRVDYATKTQAEELQDVIDKGKVMTYKFEMCPGVKKAQLCPAASMDRCKEWHLCFLCARNGVKAEDCFAHKAGPGCPHHKERPAKAGRKF